MKVYLSRSRENFLDIKDLIQGISVSVCMLAFSLVNANSVFVF